MPGWIAKVKIKHLFTEQDDHASVQASMNAVADVLKASPDFWQFPLGDFRNIPQGDKFFGPRDYANKLLDAMYDYADEYRIWIE